MWLSSIGGIRPCLTCHLPLPDRALASSSCWIATGDDGQPDLPSGGHAELPGGGQLDYLV
jgi:hypothetical protein